ncbi:MAG: hypothetical protein HC836_36940 [Richelia sp. RM2_1_2]|nr:hypothetical protein [Richelia sp. RM2_1_2]
MKAHQRHIKSLIDVLTELKDLAEGDYDCDRLLDGIRSSLNYIVSEIEPSNVLAMAMVQDASSIQCPIDQSEFLINAASAILNKINANFDAAQPQQTE